MTATASTLTVSDWIRVVRAEYLEMPGLILTERQVRRLWSLDAASCDAVLEALIAAQFLRRTPTNAYARARVNSGSLASAVAVAGASDAPCSGPSPRSLRARGTAQSTWNEPGPRPRQGTGARCRRDRRRARLTGTGVFSTPDGK